jgi:hypothetical protein
VVEGDVSLRLQGGLPRERAAWYRAKARFCLVPSGAVRPCSRADAASVAGFLVLAHHLGRLCYAKVSGLNRVACARSSGAIAA